MTFDEIMADLEPMLVIDPMSRDLDQYSLKCGRVFMAAQRHYQRESAYLESLVNQKARLDLHLTRYYEGSANPQVYVDRPLKVRPSTKTEVPSWVKADQLYQELSIILEEQKRKVKFLEGVFGQVKQMSYDIRNAIEWRKYLDGN